MTGGTLNTTGTRSSIGDTAVGKAVFNLSDGAATFNDRIMLGDHGHGEINMSGGTLGSNVGINMGCRGGTSGDIYLSDGTITVPSIWLGDDGGATAILEVTGGAINLSDTLYVNTYSSGSLGGMMSLDGGVVTASALSMVNADDVAGTLDIAGGTLILDGEIDSSWQYYVDGWVTANGGTGTLDFDYDSGSDTTTITAVPEPATMGLLALGGLGVLIRRKR
ncbi:MAG: PEP-CTERM sorting domain-containing protein [Phycisphaerae bacterium]|nr:PEP-CTERM sorting domain-containing protein [Phycisphaerae bacterium]